MEGIRRIGRVFLLVVIVGIFLLPAEDVEGAKKKTGKVKKEMFTVEQKYFLNSLQLVKKGGKYGIALKNGTIVLPIEYDYIMEDHWSKKAFFAEKKGKYYLGNENGRLASKEPYESLMHFYFSGKYFRAVKKKKTGLIDKKGKMILSFAYDDVEYFSDSLFKTLKNGKVGLVNKKNKTILKPVYEAIYNDYSKKLVRVKKDGKFGYINQKGKIVIPPKYEEYYEEILPSVFAMKKDGKWKLLDEKGKQVGEYDYDYVYQFRNEEGEELFSGFTRDGKTYIYHATGTELTSLPGTKVTWYDPDKKIAVFKNKEGKYAIYKENVGILLSDCKDEIQRVDEKNGFAVVRKEIEKDDYLYGVMNLKGEILLPMDYRYIFNLTEFEGAFAVLKDKGFGFVNKKNEVVLPFDYVNMNVSLNPKYVIVSKKIGDTVKRGIANTKGELLIPTEYDDIYLAPESEIVEVGNDAGSKYFTGAVDLKGKTVIPMEYSAIESFDQYGYSIIRKHEEFKGKNNAGLIDRKYQILFPIEYSGIYPLENGGFILENYDEKTDRYYEGYANADGKTMIPIKYAKMLLLRNGLLRLEYYDEENGYGLGLWNVEGKEILPPKFSNIFEVEQNYLFLEKCEENSGERVYWLAKPDGSLMTEKKFRKLGGFFENKFAAQSGEKWGFVDLNGKFNEDAGAEIIYEKWLRD